MLEEVPVLEGLLQDAVKKSSSSSSSSKRPAGAGGYRLFPGVGCSGFWGSLAFWGSFREGTEVAPNTSVSPVGGGTGQPQQWARVGRSLDFTGGKKKDHPPRTISFRSYTKHINRTQQTPFFTATEHPMTPITWSLKHKEVQGHCLLQEYELTPMNELFLQAIRCPLKLLLLSR